MTAIKIILTEITLVRKVWPRGWTGSTFQTFRNNHFYYSRELVEILVQDYHEKA